MKSYKYSLKRDALEFLLKSTGEHPTAKWLHVELQLEFPDIRMSTVQRNLDFLYEQKRINRLLIGTDVRYDGVMEQHYHLLCSCCGRLIDIFYLFPTAMFDYISDLNFCHIDKCNMTFDGQCADCLRKSRAKAPD